MGYTSHDILGFDYIQMFVGNARHSAHYFCRLYGFEIVGYMGSETGVRDKVSYLLRQNDLLWQVTSATVPQHEIHDFVNKHGDGVKEYSFRVKNVDEVFAYATSKGAEAFMAPEMLEDENGSMRKATIKIYGDTLLSFVDRTRYNGYLYGFKAYEGTQDTGPDHRCGLLSIDHIVGNVAVGEMDKWASFFEDCLDFETFVHFDKGDISTKYSSLVSKVVRSKNEAIKLPINESAEGLKKSQIEEYLETNYGPGVQHIAIRTDNIIESIARMERNGVEFIETPSTYYDVVHDRVVGISEDVELLKAHNILIDRDGDGYLLQLFTKPVGDRPTLFFEFIQRRGSEGFGQNNFQSLFESIEREQAKRGNL